MIANSLSTIKSSLAKPIPNKNIMNLIERLPGRASLIIATLIFAASNAVTRQLTDLGAQHLIDGRNPISFCNVLFVGNLWAFLILALIYPQNLKRSYWKTLSPKQWLFLTVVALLSGALGPALFFGALGKTSVSNVVLIGRIEPPLTLALSVIFLKERVNLWVASGAIVAFLGVGLTLLISPPASAMAGMGGFQLGVGEVMTLTAAIAGAIAGILSKITLQDISIGFFSLYRNALGTLIFFLVVIKLFGWSHFMDVFTPVLWQWMFLYSAIIVVAGQFFWLDGLKRTDASEVSLVKSFSPLAAIALAYLILGETPTLGQYIGGSVVAIAIILNQIGIFQITTAPTETPETGVGFKGV